MILVFIVVLVAILAFAVYREGLELCVFEGALITSVFVTFLLYFVLTGCGSYDTTKVYYKGEVKHMVALQDNLGSSGSFFLATGSYESEMCYYFLYKTSKGIKSGKVKSRGNVYIKYTKDEPRVEYYYTTKKYVSENIFNRFSMGHDRGLDYINIYVQEGTIKNDFNVDLK